MTYSKAVGGSERFCKKARVSWCYYFRVKFRERGCFAQLICLEIQALGKCWPRQEECGRSRVWAWGGGKEWDGEKGWHGCLVSLCAGAWGAWLPCKGGDSLNRRLRVPSFYLLLRNILHPARIFYTLGFRNNCGAEQGRPRLPSWLVLKGIDHQQVP